MNVITIPSKKPETRSKFSIKHSSKVHQDECNNPKDTKLCKKGKNTPKNGTLDPHSGQQATINNHQINRDEQSENWSKQYEIFNEIQDIHNIFNIKDESPHVRNVLQENLRAGDYNNQEMKGSYNTQGRKGDYSTQERRADHTLQEKNADLYLQERCCLPVCQACGTKVFCPKCAAKIGLKNNCDSQCTISCQVIPNGSGEGNKPREGGRFINKRNFKKFKALLKSFRGQKHDELKYAGNFCSDCLPLQKSEIQEIPGRDGRFFTVKQGNKGAGNAKQYMEKESNEDETKENQNKNNETKENDVNQNWKAQKEEKIKSGSIEPIRIEYHQTTVSPISLGQSSPISSKDILSVSSKNHLNKINHQTPNGDKLYKSETLEKDVSLPALQPTCPKELNNAQKLSFQILQELASKGLVLQDMQRSKNKQENSDKTTLRFPKIPTKKSMSLVKNVSESFTFREGFSPKEDPTAEAKIKRNLSFKANTSSNKVDSTEMQKYTPNSNLSYTSNCNLLSSFNPYATYIDSTSCNSPFPPNNNLLKPDSSSKNTVDSDRKETLFNPNEKYTSSLQGTNFPNEFDLINQSYYCNQNYLSQTDCPERVHMKKHCSQNGTLNISGLHSSKTNCSQNIFGDWNGSKPSILQTNSSKPLNNNITKAVNSEISSKYLAHLNTAPPSSGNYTSISIGNGNISMVALPRVNNTTSRVNNTISRISNTTRVNNLTISKVNNVTSKVNSSTSRVNNGTSTVKNTSSTINRTSSSIASTKERLSEILEVPEKEDAEYFQNRKIPNVPCYVCKKMFSAFSIFRHEPECLKNWRAANYKLPIEERQKEPTRSDVLYLQKDYLDFLMVINQLWMEHLAELIPCKICGRTFFPDRIKKHEKACKKLCAKGFRLY